MAKRRNRHKHSEAQGPLDAAGGPGIRLRARAQPGQIEIWRPHGDDPILVQNAEPGRRPFIHPIVMPDGEAVLTVEPTPDDSTPPALSIGLGDVNGVDFWNEGSGGGTGTRGTFHPLLVGPQRLRDGGVLWSVITDWRAPDGTSLLGDSQRWTMTDHGHAYTLDLLWTLSAHVALTIGRTADGGLSLRVPWRREHGGTILNSEGQSNEAAEGQRARWLTTSVPLPGRPPGRAGCGIAILDHPANRAHPVPWRADEQLGVGPAPGVAGAWSLAEGDLAEFRYRLFIYAGETDPNAIEAAWQAFATENELADGEADDSGGPSGQG